MEYKDIITKAATVFNDRGEQYGNLDQNMERACLIYNTITGDSFTPYQANMFLHSLKLSRIRSNRKKGDNYIDGVNYLAFAASAAGAHDDVPVPVKMPTAPIFTGPADELESGIKEMAQKLSPRVDNPDLG
jgi:hypothetical protein